MFKIEKFFMGYWLPERQRNLEDKLPETKYSSREEAERIGIMLYGKGFKTNENYRIRGN